MEYRLVSGCESRGVEKEVNELLKQGWTLYGDVSISEAFNGRYSTSITYCQAMIKE